MKEDEIKEIMQTGKCMTLECKRAKSEVPKLVNSLIMAYL